MESLDCLVIDCFYDFGHFKNLKAGVEPQEMQRYEQNWSEVANLISSGSRYEKLALGADGLRSLFLPRAFLNKVFDGFVKNQTRIG